MDDLEVIRRAIEEHHKIRSGLRQVGAAVNDMEALFGLQQAHASWGQGSVKEITDTLGRVQQTVNEMKQGLDRHFGFEEQYLPPVFGENLMKALLLEHSEVRQKLNDCEESVNRDVQGLPQERLLEYRTTIERTIADLTAAIEGHASREEVVLRMLERALEKEKQDKAR